VRVPGWGTTATLDELSGIGLAKYFQTLTDILVGKGLVRGSSLRGAPYDFRHTPYAQWLTDMESLVEDT